MLSSHLTFAGISSTVVGIVVQQTLANPHTGSYHEHARAGVDSLQKWYNQATGLWNTASWWVSANCLTVLGDMTELDPSMLNSSKAIFHNTLSHAPSFKSDPNLRTAKSTVRAQDLMHSANEGASDNFINGFYDDEGWWALGFIQAYDVTHDARYITAAADIFDDMTTGWNATCGGIWWDKAHTQNAAIANEIFLSVAAHLARRLPEQKSHYKDWALKEWKWFKSSGLINSQNTINDGLDLKTCKNNKKTVWSYNQGVILGGLVELFKISGDKSLLSTAHRIASAAIKALSDENGILRESCDPNCTGDATQFKGIFMRNLQCLEQESASHEIRRFLKRNADSIWANDRGSGYTFGSAFAGPYSPANASTQSAACNALVAAAAVL